ncbi:lysophospholipase [Porticoccaceae bacterium]|nr:lysophospholipase [Porticoccaceae bacterium]MDA8651312.1 lysophospholipase [Porticoccaceae bacterium]MDA8789013.1 lysophospholipase [Porticoccaceae bacterium]MDB2635129.1 lysophospholipase [Porticoccaceae bacterium]MDB2664853.1 lysophospholipase [Porticoccaceae bacterium]
MTVLRLIISVVLLIIVVAAMGPRVDMSVDLIPVDLSVDLDKYLDESESQFPDIVEGTEKTIIWANTPGEKTDIAIVSIHGFSATRQELSPLADHVASALRANLFYTRLAGHGRGGRGMTDGSINGWANDANEAMAIGRQLGEKVVLFGNSTGSTLATWLALQKENSDIAALVLIAPNYYSADSATDMFLWPWGKQLAQVLIGKTRSWTSDNPLHEKYWANHYATSSLLPVMGLVKLVDDSELSQIKTPALMIYSSRDQTISPAAVESTFPRFGSREKELVEFSETEDSSYHILAGDLMSPSSTEAVAEIINDFLYQQLN